MDKDAWEDDHPYAPLDERNISCGSGGLPASLNMNLHFNDHPLFSDGLHRVDVIKNGGGTVNSSDWGTAAATGEAFWDDDPNSTAAQLDISTTMGIPGGNSPSTDNIHRMFYASGAHTRPGTLAHTEVLIVNGEATVKMRFFERRAEADGTMTDNEFHLTGGSPSRADLGFTLEHEFGHAIGLGHINGNDSVAIALHSTNPFVMWDGVTLGNVDRVPNFVESEALLYIYPPGP